MTTTIPFKRRPDGSYTVGATALGFYFDNADQAMAAYVELIQRIGQTERDAQTTEAASS